MKRKINATYTFYLLSLYIVLLILVPLSTQRWITIGNLTLSISTLLFASNLLIFFELKRCWAPDAQIQLFYITCGAHIMLYLSIKLICYLPVGSVAVLNQLAWEQIIFHMCKSLLFLSFIWATLQLYTCHISTKSKGFVAQFFTYHLRLIKKYHVPSIWLLIIICLVNWWGESKKLILFWLSNSLVSLIIWGILENCKRLLLHKLIFAPPKQPVHFHLPYLLLCIIFWTCLMITNLATVRFVMLGRWLCTAGIVLYPCTFFATDLMTELWGDGAAKQAVWGGVLAILAITLSLLLINALPCALDSPLSKELFASTFSFVPGIFFASTIAYLLAQFLDIYLFTWLRQQTAGKHLWLRNNVATIVSQAIDTLTFALLFWGLWASIFPLQGSNIAITCLEVKTIVYNEYMVKIIFALLDTPLVYLLCKYLKRPTNQIDV